MRQLIKWLLISFYIAWQLCTSAKCFEQFETITNNDNKNDTTKQPSSYQEGSIDEGASDDEIEDQLEDEIASAIYPANEQHNNDHRLKLDSHTISRLRNMIHESHKQATDHAREMGLVKGLKSIKEHFKDEKKRLKGKDKGKGGGGSGGGGYDYPYYPIGPPLSGPPPNYNGQPPNYYGSPGPYGYDEYNYFGRGPADSYAQEDKKKGSHGLFSKKDKKGGGQNMHMSGSYPPPHSPPQPYNYPSGGSQPPIYSYSRIPYPQPPPSTFMSSSYSSASASLPPPPPPSPPSDWSGPQPSKTNHGQQQEVEQSGGTKGSSSQEVMATDNKGQSTQSQVLEGMPSRELMHSDARQASIFSGLHVPGSNPFQLGQQSLFQPNPLVSNSLFQPPKLPNLAPFPTLPKLPTLPLLPTISMTPRPPPKPKMSVIGNDSGPMSLNNDNVVVVNVLSNNW